MLCEEVLLAPELFFAVGFQSRGNFTKQSLSFVLHSDHLLWVKWGIECVVLLGGHASKLTVNINVRGCVKLDVGIGVLLLLLSALRSHLLRCSHWLLSKVLELVWAHLVILVEHVAAYWSRRGRLSRNWCCCGSILGNVFRRQILLALSVELHSNLCCFLVEINRVARFDAWFSFSLFLYETVRRVCSNLTRKVGDLGCQVFHGIFNRGLFLSFLGRLLLFIAYWSRFSRNLLLSLVCFVLFGSFDVLIQILNLLEFFFFIFFKID